MKFPAEAASKVAQELMAALEPACGKIEIAGSLRRRKREVSDVEILFVPIYVPNIKSDFFGDPRQTNLAEEVITLLLDTGAILKRFNVNGHKSWGLMNKLAVHTNTGIPVDLFTANQENFYNYLVCRTGPSESNVRICEAAIARGWKWNPYGNGFSRKDDLHACSSEREVFEFVGLPYREPWER